MPSGIVVVAAATTSTHHHWVATTKIDMVIDFYSLLVIWFVVVAGVVGIVDVIVWGCVSALGYGYAVSYALFFLYDNDESMSSLFDEVV